eukprot:5526203-Prymnesium_polylepis.1
MPFRLAENGVRWTRATGTTAARGRPWRLACPFAMTSLKWSKDKGINVDTPLSLSLPWAANLCGVPVTAHTRQGGAQGVLGWR